jgi:predicted glycogen debranching enzyme
MTPAPGERLVRFVGDRVRFGIRTPQGFAKGWRALLRTNLGKAERLRQEIIATHAGKNPVSIAFWRDVPLQEQSSGEWSIELPLTDVGFYSAKPYALDPEGRQYWPEGPDAGVSVHPAAYRTANTIYCAFSRMFGPTKIARFTQDPVAEAELNKLDKRGYVVIPPSGTLRDLIRELPHIMDTLGCRIIQLLPINPTPTTFARFGRFGSPYACQDLTAVDPALVEFDKKYTGIEQFEELTCAVHRRGGRVLLDMVINHTGWGSTLYEKHPEWFLRHDDGTFASPGAWGVEWGDLVELNPVYLDLWDELAQAFLTWCRRGVDGFRCDAGYKVPLPVWQYIEAKVRQEFPDTLFLLEGLGGALEATEALLTDGGMQWAYSELFQNYSGTDVARYLDYSINQSKRVGLYVNFSETHDNDRLAAKGKTWALMRNQLCALASVSGGFAFTCGVEWLAQEKINVHSSRGLSWGNKDNLLPELSALNHLLATHPCFFDGAKLERLSPENSDVYALRRESAEGLDSVLVLVNTDATASHDLTLAADIYKTLGQPRLDLLGQKPPKIQAGQKEIVFTLPPGAAYCLAAKSKPAGLAGDDYRRARAQSSWGITALSKILLPEEIGPCPWQNLAARIHADAHEFLGSICNIDRTRSRIDLSAALDAAKGKFPQVVSWTLLDRRRITSVPPGHWLLLQDERRFRAALVHPGAGPCEQIEAIEVKNGFVACIPPKYFDTAVEADLTIERYGLTNELVDAKIRFLAPGPVVSSTLARPPARSLVLLTNGRGGMARLCVDLGQVNSKYDCALGANLNPDIPVDRHIFAKRIRVWVTADGFTTALNLQNLASFKIGPPAIWTFVAEAGDGRTVEIQLAADMIDGTNTTVFTFARLPGTQKADLPAQFNVHLTVRVDIEDRNFHTETHHNGGADFHFTSNTHPLADGIGFDFTPAPDRQMRAFSSAGVFHPQPEWCDNIPHPVEESRGQVASSDAFSPGWFELPLAKSQPVAIVLTAETKPPTFAEVEKAAGARSLQEKKILDDAKFPETDLFGRRLAIAARAFVAKRGTGKTVIAGYPWFLDWGRDTFISARGLLAAGMVSDVADLLVTFGRFSENGTMPNTIHGDNASNRDTSDASLWYGVVCEETAALMGAKLYETAVDKNSRTISTVLQEIASGYARGTPNGIRMDPESALIWSPSHFTWMDTNYPAATPRQGYPVEIQVLWIRLLRQLQRLGIKSNGDSWETLANRAEQSLQKYFWIEDKGYISDLLIANAGEPASKAVCDQALRGNYLFAIAFGMFSGNQARRAVDAALRYLIIPGALRTLAPLPTSPPLPVYAGDGHLLNNPTEPYWGRYTGDEDTRRKPAYHNGTAWGWTFPTACEALAKAWDNSPGAVAAARAYLASMDQLLLTNCLGQLPEILDGDTPHTPRGCDAQAWSVTEALRVWKLLA